MSIKITKYAIIVLSAYCSLIGCSNSGSKTEISVPISVNPAVELVSTIHYLAGTGQYHEGMLPDYLKRIENYFGKSRDHSAVTLAKEMNRSDGINGSAPMALAVYLGAPPLLETVCDMSPRPKDLESRWTPDLIDTFLTEARRFARDTRFMDFFNSQKDFHAKAVSNLEETLRDEDILSWYKDFFGYSPKNCRLYIGLINGTCNYGFSVTHRSGKQEFLALLGARNPGWDGVPRYSKEWFIPVIIHEYIHSYINPLINDNPEQYRELGEALLVSHRQKMIKHGYNAWNVLLFEYIVRACSIHYFQIEDGDKRAQELIDCDERDGFSEIRGLVKLLSEYENNRTEYPDIGSFLPNIKAYFESCLIE